MKGILCSSLFIVRARTRRTTPPLLYYYYTVLLHCTVHTVRAAPQHYTTKSCAASALYAADRAHLQRGGVALLA